MGFRLWLCCFCVTGSLLCSNSAKGLFLRELTNPHCLRAVQKELLILQEGTVLVYDPASGRLIREFARIGDGPGESRKFGKRGSMLWGDGQRVMIDSLQKVSFFAPDGKVLQEIRKPDGLFFNLPQGHGFVSLRRHQTGAGETMFELCQTKEAFSNPLGLTRQEPGATRKRLDLFPDALNFAVNHKGLLYEEGGELIWKARPNGSVRRIKLPRSSFPVSEAMKKDALGVLAADWETRQMGGLEALMRQTEVHISQTVPAVREISLDEELAFIWTYAETQDPEKGHFWVMEIPTGRLVGQLDLPLNKEIALDDAITGRIDRLYSFSGDWYYALSFDEARDAWQVLRVNWREKI